MYKILFSFLSALCIYFSFINPLPEKLSPSVNLFNFLLVLVSSYFLNRFGQISVFFTITGMLFVIYKFSNNKWLNLSCALFGYIFSITLNYPCIWIAQYLLHKNLNQIYENHQLTLAISILVCLFCFLTTKILGHIMRKQLKINDLLKDSKLNFTIFLCLLFFSIIYVINFSYGEMMGYNYSIITFSGILFLLLFITIVYLMHYIYRNTLRTEQAKYQLSQYDNLQIYTNELEKLYTSMRQFKHDYMNILTTLSTYIDQEDITALKEYFHNEILPTSHAFTDSDTKLGALANIKELPLKSIVSSKIIHSIELGIKTELEVMDPIHDVYINPVDYSRIVGIFLDNAIEAASETDEKLLRFCMIKKENSLITIVENTTTPLTSPLASLTEFGVSSKGTLRGVGLNNVKNITDQYQNLLWDTEYSAPIFTQRLTMTSDSNEHNSI